MVGDARKRCWQRHQAQTVTRFPVTGCRYAEMLARAVRAGPLFVNGSLFRLLALKKLTPIGPSLTCLALSVVFPRARFRSSSVPQPLSNELRAGTSIVGTPAKDWPSGGENRRATTSHGSSKRCRAFECLNPKRKRTRDSTIGGSCRLGALRLTSCHDDQLTRMVALSLHALCLRRRRLTSPKASTHTPEVCSTSHASSAGLCSVRTARLQLSVQRAAQKESAFFLSEPTS